MSRTLWSPIPTDASANGVYAWPWVVGMDDEVVVDLAPQLATDELPDTIACRLMRLRLTTESADLDVSTTNCIGDATIDGTSVRQRINALVADRVYRLFVLHGPEANRRAASVVIEVES